MKIIDISCIIKNFNVLKKYIVPIKDSSYYKTYRFSKSQNLDNTIPYYCGDSANYILQIILGKKKHEKLLKKHYQNVNQTVMIKHILNNIKHTTQQNIYYVTIDNFHTFILEITQDKKIKIYQSWADLYALGMSGYKLNHSYNTIYNDTKLYSKEKRLNWLGQPLLEKSYNINKQKFIKFITKILHYDYNSITIDEISEIFKIKYKKFSNKLKNQLSMSNKLLMKISLVKI